MKDGKAPKLAVMLGIGHHEPDGDESPSAAQDLIDAVKDGDAEAVHAAFHALYEKCKAEEESEDYDSKDME